MNGETRTAPPERVQKDVIRAARYAGYASAMAIGSYMLGNERKAAIWQAEENAWQKRTDAGVDGSPFGHVQLKIDALNSHNAASVALDSVGAIREARLVREEI